MVTVLQNYGIISVRILTSKQSIHQSYSDFLSFICTCACVCVFVCIQIQTILPCVGLYIHHYSQDIKHFHQHKHLSCCSLITKHKSLLPPPITNTISWQLLICPPFLKFYCFKMLHKQSLTVCNLQDFVFPTGQFKSFVLNYSPLSKYMLGLSLAGLSPHHQLLSSITGVSQCQKEGRWIKFTKRAT